MACISNSFAPVRRLRTSGPGARANGDGEPCPEPYRYRWIGRSMSLMKRQAPLQPGLERDCPPKQSSIGPHMGRRMAKKNEIIHGAMTRRIPDGETSTGPDGILFPCPPPRLETAHSEFPNSPVTDGSGLRRSFNLFPDASPCRVIPDTQHPSSIA